MTAKTAVKGIKGKTQLGHAVYDFAIDGGTAGAIDLFSLPANTIVHDCWYEVETALTSGGSATVEVGVTGGDTDGFIAQVAYTVLSLDKVSAEYEKGALLFNTTEDSSLRYKVGSAVTIAFLIATASLTGGKVHFYAEYSDGY